MRRVRRKSSTGQMVRPEPAEGEGTSAVTIAMIQALIPLGLRAVEEGPGSRNSGPASGTF